jgi:hypothetical protein
VKQLLEDLPYGMKSWLDALSFSALLGSIVNLLPALATVLTIVWTMIRIYETDTVQRLVKGREANDG